MIGTKFSRYDFEGRHDYVVLAYDGKLYTIGYMFGDDLVHDFKLDEEDLKKFMGV